jgi:hypothetical protein
MPVVTKSYGDVRPGAMALPESSPPGPAGPAWTRQKHQEDQEEVADLPRAPEHAGESQSMEIDGDQ